MSESTVPASTDPVPAADPSERMIPLSAVAPLLLWAQDQLMASATHRLIEAYDQAAVKIGLATAKEIYNCPEERKRESAKIYGQIRRRSA